MLETTCWVVNTSNTTNETALKMKMLKLDEFEIRNTNF